MNEVGPAAIVSEAPLELVLSTSRAEVTTPTNLRKRV